MAIKRREFLGGTVAGAVAAIVGSAQNALSKTDEPIEPAVFVMIYPPGNSVDHTGKLASNHELAAILAKELRRDSERWVLLPGSVWGIQCVPDRPYKVSERVGVLFEFEEGKPRGRARVWDEHSGREFHQVKWCNTVTGEICYYRNTNAKIDVPLIVITEWVKDLRVQLEDESTIYKQEPAQ